MVARDGHVLEIPAATHDPFRRSSRPSSISISSISSTNSGFPSAASRIRARASSARSASPRRCFSRSSLSGLRAARAALTWRSACRLPRPDARPGARAGRGRRAGSAPRGRGRRRGRSDRGRSARPSGRRRRRRRAAARAPTASNSRRVAKKSSSGEDAPDSSSVRTSRTRVLAQLVQHLEERPERDPLAVGEAAARDDARVGFELARRAPPPAATCRRRPGRES